ncbi:MAG TPA: response regulator [Candidatus Acidoferrum sp.]|nr:response regulator [Candidatus Acidoferrum sp.]
MPGPMRDAGPERDDALAYFVPEAADLLDIMSRSLLALEHGQGGEDDIATLFRAIHTLKGAAYVVGHVRVGDLAHRIEDVLAAARSTRGSLGVAAIDAIHAAVEAARCLLGLTDVVSLENVTEVHEQALARLATATPPAATGIGDAGAPASSSIPPAEPVSPAPLAAAPGAAPSRGSIAGMRLDLLVNLAGELVAARRRVEGRLRELERVGEVLSLSRTRMAKAVGEFEELQGSGFDLLTGQGEPQSAIVKKSKPDPLFAELDLDRFDHVDMVGRSLAEITADLAVAQTQVAGLARGLSEDTGWIQRLTGTLRSEITRARLVPVGRMFARVARQVREAASAAGKSVALEVTGESVEVDSAIVEQMTAPILHLLQNAITHGIEREDERRARGKPAQGKISLRASHRGGSIHIEMSDDGRGIDVERLKAEAVRRGLVPPEVARLMDGTEALELIFQPGLSTASAVTPSAGRGVGLDVVRTTVGRLNGEVAVASEAGAGTRFTIRLPLTVLVSEALLVRVGSEILAIPVNAVKRIVAVPCDEVERAGRAERVRVEDQPLDLLRLDRLLGLTPDEERARLCVVALRAAGRPVALAVDELLGKEEIVVRGLGEFLGSVGPFGGATLSDEGRIILLLDPARLLETPGASAAAVPARAEPAITPAAPAEPPGPRRILLVDDSISVRKFVGQMLERAGFAVITAADGVEGLQVLEETPVDAVITDLEMPRLNGFELIQELRRRAATRDLPIVVLTTRVGAKHLNLARWLGVTDYVAKPVDEPAFLRLMDSATTPKGPA